MILRLLYMLHDSFCLVWEELAIKQKVHPQLVLLWGTLVETNLTQSKDTIVRNLWPKSLIRRAFVDIKNFRQNHELTHCNSTRTWLILKDVDWRLSSLHLGKLWIYAYIPVLMYRHIAFMSYSCIDSFGKLITFSSVNSFNLKKLWFGTQDSHWGIRWQEIKNSLQSKIPMILRSTKRPTSHSTRFSFGKCFHERDDGIWITAAGSRLYRNWPPCRPWQPANRMLWSECSPGKCLHQYTNPTMTLLHTLATVMLLKRQIQTTNKKHSNILPTSLEYCWNFQHSVCFHK